MLSPNFLPAIYGGLKFDRGMQLLELMSQRSEPEADIQTYTGEYKDCGRFVSHIDRFIRERIEVVQVPQPKMLIGGELYPDGFITNAADVSDDAKDRMSRKITGVPYDRIAPGYYRAAWLPPPTRHATLKEAIFHYPKDGYAGALADMVGTKHGGAIRSAPYCVDINIAFLRGFPSMQESVIFVVDDSPIYRVTNQEACIGRRFAQSRLVVEFRGECDVISELRRLCICFSAEMLGQITMKLPTPTDLNLAQYPRLFTNTLNDQLCQILKSSAQQITEA